MLLRKYFQKPFKYQETKKKLKEGFDDNTDMHTYTISTWKTEPWLQEMQLLLLAQSLHRTLTSITTPHSFSYGFGRSAIYTATSKPGNTGS